MKIEEKSLSFDWNNAETAQWHTFWQAKNQSDFDPKNFFNNNVFAVYGNADFIWHRITFLDHAPAFGVCRYVKSRPT